MKYTISINQKALHEIAPELDLVHYAILDYLYFICSSVSEKIAKSRIHDMSGSWTWIDYSHLMSEMPALKIKTASSITKRIQAIVQSGFIKTMKGHRFRIYAQLLPKIDSVFVETKASVRSNESYQAHQRSFKRKDHTTIDHTTTDKEALFDSFWKEYPKKVGKVVAQRCFGRLNPSKELLDNILEDVWQRKESEEWQKEKGKFVLNPATYLNQRRWEDETKLAPPMKKPYFHGEEMRKKGSKWFVLPLEGGSWLEFAGNETEIEWK